MPSITERARTDLPERCLHWLLALLCHKLPPGRVLELGAAHGGFVALLGRAGFDAMGLEISPTIAELARRTFNVTMLEGRVEDQGVVPSSLDVIVLFDVLEHLDDPAATMAHCVNLLKQDGFLLVQTPRVPPGAAYQELLARGDPFLAHLKPEEHCYLFTEDGVRELFQRLGVPQVAFLPAFFAHYDMFFTASRTALTMHSEGELAAALRSPEQRLLLALLDLQAARRQLQDQYAELARHLDEVERDREARLALIQTLDTRLGRLEAERAGRLGRGAALASVMAPGRALVRWLAGLRRGV